ncbi:MAG: dTDP-4-dehydrorhamnose reductase [Candidatus Hydrogenedentes bacterium]|nr:dTDP-4-dehydrorhamnose reductase [Candidatus Hydrogenedentota bacterium]
MKTLLIGALGQLGQDLCRVYNKEDLVAADLDGGDISFDVRDREAVVNAIETVQPEVVINAAAALNVPKCEEETAFAYAVNATAARDLAVACHAAKVRLVHISTDYVFGYGHATPIGEGASPAPLSTYGASKLAGEYLVAAECSDHLIVRTAAIYGTAPCRAKGGRNFVSTMLHLASARGEVSVITDEFTTPTHTHALAKQIQLLAQKGEPGIYHATCQGSCSWYEFAKTIFELTQTEVELKKALQADFPSPVKRPSYSVLENEHLKRLNLDIMPHWKTALEEYLAQMKLLA